MIQVTFKVNRFQVEQKGHVQLCVMDLCSFGLWTIKLHQETKEPYIFLLNCDQAFLYKNPHMFHTTWHITPLERIMFDYILITIVMNASSPLW